jgi:hypothetical protein
MIKRSEFIIGMVIMFFLFLFVNGLIVSDINETMRTLKRPVVLHDTTSVMRYIDRYIHDTTVITQTKTEYIEKVSLIGKMQDYADPEEKETTFKLETDGHLFEFDAKYVKFQCNGKLVETEDDTVCAGDWVFTAKEIIE